MVHICDRLKTAFVKHFDLPIQLVQDPYFDYFLKLYDKDFDTINKYNMFCDVIETYFSENGKDLGFSKNGFGTYNNYDNFMSGFKYTVVDEIKNLPEYDKFNKADLSKYPFKNRQKKKSNLYIPENNCVCYMSIDLRKANFQAMKYFDPMLVLGASEYNEMISQVLGRKLVGEVKLLNFIVQSKQLRQFIFGNLNCSRQIHIVKHLNDKIYELLLKLFNEVEKSEEDIEVMSHDEIVIRFCISEDIDGFKKKIEESDLSDLPDFRIDMFTLNLMYPLHPYYVKVYRNSEKVEIKTVPDYFFAQAYKHYHSLPLNVLDMSFYHEGLVAEFKDQRYFDCDNC